MSDTKDSIDSAVSGDPSSPDASSTDRDTKGRFCPGNPFGRGERKTKGDKVIKELLLPLISPMIDELLSIFKYYAGQTREEILFLKGRSEILRDLLDRVEAKPTAKMTMEVSKQLGSLGGFDDMEIIAAAIRTELEAREGMVNSPAPSLAKSRPKKSPVPLASPSTGEVGVLNKAKE